MLNRILRRLYTIGLSRLLRYPNTHIGADAVRTFKTPFSKRTMIIRKTRSDVSRVCEYVNDIYTAESYLNDALVASKPTALIDIGANIGMATLALMERFPTITQVYGVEAEPLNFSVLEKNYDSWSGQFEHTTFTPINAIATNDSTMQFAQSKLENQQGLTASGTFQFQQADAAQDADTVKTAAVAIADIVAKLPEDAVILCKVDIEGGEEYLFAKNTEWMSRMAFLTLELHDRFAPEMLNSSTPVLKAVLDYDFAVQPDRDILLCYARSLLKS